MSETGCECSDNLVNSFEVTPVSDSSESEEKTNSQRPLDNGDGPLAAGPGGGFDGSRQQGFSSESNHCDESFVSLIPGTCQPVATPKETDRSEMVAPCPRFCNKEPKPLHPPGTIFQINGTVSEGYAGLIDKFSSLMVGIHEAVTKNSVPMRPFTVRLMGNRCNMMLGTVKSPGELKLSDIKDWNKMFDTLSDIKAWDCFNYSLLRKVIDDCLKESEDYAHLKSEIEIYDGAVEDFLQSTLLVEFLDVFRELFPDDSSYYQGCGRLKAKLTGDLATMTMAKYRSTKGHLMSQFRLQNCVLQLAVASSGCVILHWYLPQYLIPHIKQHCKVLQPDFGQAGVIELCIDDCVLYQASNIAEIVHDEGIEPASDVMSKYDQLLAESINQPKEFWSRMALKTLLWDKPFTKQRVLKGCDMSKGKICWFDGRLNASVNCLDRHAEATPNKVAIIWEKNDGSSERISYQKLLEMTCQIAHVLKSKEVKKGGVVLIYMPSSPIAVAAMLACTRIGAVHCVVYAVLKNNELEARINDANAQCIITSDVAMIGDKTYELKATVDRALTSLCLRSKSKLGSRCNSSKSLDFLSETPPPPMQPYFGLQRSVSSGEHSLGDEEEPPPFPVKKAKNPFIVLMSTLSENEGMRSKVPWNAECDFRLEEEMARHATRFDPVSVEAEHTMFIMYTSGTTAGGANPIGIKHCTAGYLLYVALTHQYVFDYKTGDVFGCMADLGWITGHSYVVYGPLCNGATTVLFEGTAMYPSKDRYWRAISQHKINQFYVTPFVISGLMKHSPDPSKYRKEHDLSSLKTIATVGEPLSSRVLKWLLKHVGGNQCKFVDTWWQTELGGIAMVIDHERSELPKGNFPAKPFFGVKPVIVDPELRGVNEKMTEPGYLCLQKSLPGMGRGITSICKQTFEQEYFSTWKGGFFTHDLALKVESGGYRVTGRLNNAIRIQGVWLDVASIEDQMNQSDKRILKSTLVGIHDKTVNTERHEYEGACILLECNSEDPAVEKEVKSKVIRTVTKAHLLPDETLGGIFPGVFVLFVKDWLCTASGKTLVAIYQDMIDLFAKVWFHTSSELPFDTFCEQRLENKRFSTR